jgi:acid phosphatase (class A)
VIGRRGFLAAAAAAALMLAALAPPVVAKTVAAPYYLPPADVDLTVLLGPPPDRNSPQEQSDEKKIAEVLANRSDADLARAAADAHRSIFVFADVLGNRFSAQSVPLTEMLFKRVASDTEALVNDAKAYFARPRPADARQSHGSYPSGHAAFAACAAILLSQMVPEKRQALFERAGLFAQSRVIAGVHYPSDVEAGWISGTVIAAALMRRPQFRDDFTAAKAEMRRALGLP